MKLFVCQQKLKSVEFPSIKHQVSADVGLICFHALVKLTLHHNLYTM